MKKNIVLSFCAVILFMSYKNNEPIKTVGMIGNETHIAGKKLIFVYNANAGLFNGVGDVVHKIISSGTYPCSLCHLTYGTFTIKPEWNAFKKNSSIPLLFLHKNEFRKLYPDLKTTPLPVIFIERAGAISILINQTELNGYKNIGELKQGIEEKLKNYND